MCYECSTNQVKEKYILIIILCLYWVELDLLLQIIEKLSVEQESLSLALHSGAGWWYCILFHDLTREDYEIKLHNAHLQKVVNDVLYRVGMG